MRPTMPICVLICGFRYAVVPMNSTGGTAFGAVSLHRPYIIPTIPKSYCVATRLMALYLCVQDATIGQSLPRTGRSARSVSPTQCLVLATRAIPWSGKHIGLGGGRKPTQAGRSVVRLIWRLPKQYQPSSMCSRRATHVHRAVGSSSTGSPRKSTSDARYMRSTGT